MVTESLGKTGARICNTPRPPDCCAVAAFPLSALESKVFTAAKEKAARNRERPLLTQLDECRTGLRRICKD